MNASSLGGTELRRAFAHVPSGVVAICADTGSERIGMAISTFVPVSLDPPLAAFCVQNTSTTWRRLAQRPRLGVSVLADVHAHAARSLAARDRDRFAGVRTETHDSGALFVAGCSVWMDVSVHQQIPAGDHAIVVLRIHELHLGDESNATVEPIVFHRSSFRTLVTA
jgi:flavin reductase (DIM6/NTAB) family NADH-FMN oxidoreductase RutF